MERNASSVSGTEIKGDRNFNAHSEDGSLQGSAAWKENPRGKPKTQWKRNEQRPIKWRL